VRKRKWTFSEIEGNPLMAREPSARKGGWSAFFGNDNPIHLEIGCGKGGFIIALAARNPGVNYIAVERKSVVMALALHKAKELCGKIENLAFVISDAEGLDELFAPGELDRIYLNFSDPWPCRKKWAKRRLTHKRFLQVYARLLRPNGEIHFKTDNRELFEFSLNEFCGQGWRLGNISLDLANSDFENIKTEYEEKFGGKGFPIFRLEAAAPPQKTGCASE
jgi:tRNA (guanine-N7-)-methyltransferase